MIDPAQTALFLVIMILTVLLIVLGVQVFFILKEFRKTVTKTNQILNHAEEISASVSTPISTLSKVLMGIKTGSTIANLIKKKERKEDSSE